MAAIALTSALLVTAGIYPESHFDYATKMTAANKDSVIADAINAGKTLFAPAWNRVVQTFANNSMVTFGDVNLQEASIGGPYQAGAGGWPTVRYFNKKTGEGGKPYNKKTSGAMCDELGNDKYMTEYVTEYGSTSLCNLADDSGCTEKELGFRDKWADKSASELDEQVARLRGMSSGSMKPDLRAWLGQRLNVLVQLSAKAAAPKEEL